MKLFNSLTRKKENFQPLKNREVKIYSCGPTVYDYAHIGNFRSYIAWDLLIRYLNYSKYKTTTVKNITDVGHFTDEDEDRGIDKLEKAAQKEKKDPLDIAKFYTKAFIETEKKLNILPPNFRPKATGEIKMMQKIIADLVKKGIAYDAKDGVYFDVSKFKTYGKLSGNTPDKILAGARVAVNPNKKHPADFALWKKLVGKNKRHSLHWPSPWGEGFPGWHIECSAMALSYLGNTIDIHTGGKDNKFPHHESEIAQSEAYTGKPFCKYWLHSNHVDINGKKMAKSEGNFYSLQNIIDKGFDPLAYRFWTLTAHYRSPLNFTWKGLKDATENWKKINLFIRDTKATSKLDKKYIINREKQFNAALDNDLNTPKSIAILLQTIKDARKDNKKNSSAIHLIKKWDQVLGILKDISLGQTIIVSNKGIVTAHIGKIDPKIGDMFAQRQLARKNKDFKKADSYRKQIEQAGFEIIDLAGGKSRLLPKK